MRRYDSPEWKLVDWPYSDGYPKCWVKNIHHGGNVFLTTENDFTYVCSCGASSDFSFTGCFFGHAEIASLAEAKAELDRRIAKRRI